MKLHVDHKTVFETESGMLGRKVAEFETPEAAKEYVRIMSIAPDVFSAAKEMVAFLRDSVLGSDRYGNFDPDYECPFCMGELMDDEPLSQWGLAVKAIDTKEAA